MSNSCHGCVANSRPFGNDEDMEKHTHGREVVFESLHRKSCMESRLVLASAGISSEVVQSSNSWQLLVRSDQLAAAQSELAAYSQERNSDTPPARVSVATFGGAKLGAFFYACVILSVYVLSDTNAYGWQWSSIGSSRAGDVMSGRWWQVFTALTLHADTAHLMSNLVFGIAFGYMAGRILGGGVAWFVIVAAGALGNAMNAAARASEHTSIGASTAVFAALGVMVAHALRPRTLVRESAMRRWSPLIGGVLMLSLIGVDGERTDVLAHVMGFVAGTILGWIGCRIPNRLLENEALQSAAGFAALLMVFVAWSAAIVWTS
jgi:rhomboid protease GluP